MASSLSVHLIMIITKEAEEEGEGGKAVHSKSVNFYANLFSKRRKRSPGVVHVRTRILIRSINYIRHGHNAEAGHSFTRNMAGQSPSPSWRGEVQGNCLSLGCCRWWLAGRVICGRWPCTRVCSCRWCRQCNFILSANGFQLCSHCNGLIELAVSGELIMQISCQFIDCWAVYSLGQERRRKPPQVQVAVAVVMPKRRKWAIRQLSFCNIGNNVLHL